VHPGGGELCYLIEAKKHLSIDEGIGAKEKRSTLVEARGGALCAETYRL